MIASNGKEVHPLRQAVIKEGESIIYERNTEHKRSWFILDLAISTSPMLFIPSASSCLVTQDGMVFYTKPKRI